MKTFMTFSVSLLLFVLLNHSSLANTPENPVEVLRMEVTKLLKNPGLSISDDQEVRISFFITADDELVVLKTDARKKEMDQFIKTRLNYKKIKIANLENNRIVHIKVHFKTV